MTALNRLGLTLSIMRNDMSQRIQFRSGKCLFNKLTSVFHGSVLLLVMNFVTTLSK